MLNVTVHSLGELTIFRCTGRITFGYANTLLNAISKWPSRRVVVLDLAGVTQIDAAGIGTLVSVRKHAEASGVALKLMNLTPRVEDLLELTRVRSTFAICSVPDMIEMLCCAIKKSQFVNVDAAENYDWALDYSETVLARSA